jgi:preprotein translocase subunit SecA
MEDRLMSQFGLSLQAAGIHPVELGRHELGDQIFDHLKAEYETKEKILGAETMRYHERMVMLSVIDGLWKDHLLAMDHLKEGIGLRGYAQQDPLVAYKRESFDMFEAMMTKFQEDTVRFLFRMQIVDAEGRPVNAAPPRPERPVPAAPPVASAEVRPSNGTRTQADGRHAPTLEAAPPREIPVHTRAPQTTIDALEKEFARKKQRELAHAAMAGGSAASQPNQRRTGEKVGRNDPCPCGSGKKYKKCHGSEA